MCIMEVHAPVNSCCFCMTDGINLFLVTFTEHFSDVLAGDWCFCVTTFSFYELRRLSQLFTVKVCQCWLVMVFVALMICWKIQVSVCTLVWLSSALWLGCRGSAKAMFWICSFSGSMRGAGAEIRGLVVFWWDVHGGRDSSKTGP